MKHTGFTFYYFGIGLVFFILEHLQLFYIAMVVKAMILPVLMVYYHFQVRDRYYLLHVLILFGLFFAWLGDLLIYLSNNNIGLSLDKELFFLAGLGSFLLTQLFYIIAFNLPRGRNPIFNRRSYLPFLVIAYGAGMIWLLYKGLGYLRVPVIVYTALILIMLLSAFNRHGKVNGVSYMFVVIGAFFFVVSDSMIGVNRFYQNFDFARILIMATYVIAQYLIALGCIKQDAVSHINGNGR